MKSASYSKQMPRIIAIGVALTLCHLNLKVSARDTSPVDKTERPANRPNVVLLIADDLGYGELGCQGNPQIPTPAIDSLAASGVRFTQAYVTASYCSSSRAGLMTGRYQTRFGYEFNPIGADNEDPLAGLPQTEKTLANYLHDLGYVTSLIGKWHLGGTARNHPHRRGFDEFFGFLHEGHYYLPPPFRGSLTMVRRKALPNGGTGAYQSGDMIYSTHMGHDEPAYDANNPILRGGQPVVEETYLTDAFTREACQFIDRNHEHPFFLTVAYNAVHSPLQATDKSLQPFASIEDLHRRIFAGMLSKMDDSVAAILAKLAAHQLEDDTLVIFLSDNGGPTRELTSSNAPLRGEKGSLYEGGIRIPFMVRWPGKLAPQVCEQPIWSLDILATLADITDARIPADRMEGVSLMAHVDQAGRIGQMEPREFYWRMNQKVAYRQGPWKLVGRRVDGKVRHWELYHLGNDLAESNDLASEQTERVEQLSNRWESIDEEMVEPLWERPR